jgi:two-component system sensor histidine kinase AtoS
MVAHVHWDSKGELAMSQQPEDEKIVPAYTPESVPDASEAPASGQVFSEIFPSLIVGIAVLDRNLTVSAWNARAEQITGYTRAQMQGTALARIGEPTEVLQQILAQAQSDIDSRHACVQLRRADSTLVSVALQCVPQHERDGSVGQTVVAMQDLAPLQRYSQRYEPLAILGQLASPLTHEIHNPLNAIFLHLDVLEEELHRPTPNYRAQMTESLAEVKSEVTRLHNLVQDYLALARLVILHREPTDLGAMVEEFVLERQEHCEARHIMLHFDGLAALGQVVLQRQVFHRVLLNLAQNAIEAMPQGGTLTFRGRRTPSQVSLDIQDTGPGIAAEELPALFKPFHAITPEDTGLRLYVAQQIIRSHGGEMTVVSAPGQGTTYTITMPPSSPPTVAQT